VATVPGGGGGVPKPGGGGVDCAGGGGGVEPCPGGGGGGGIAIWRVCHVVVMPADDPVRVVSGTDGRGVPEPDETTIDR